MDEPVKKKGPTILTDIEVETVGLVESGMVGKTFFLVKSDDTGDETLSDVAVLEKKIAELEAKLNQEPVEKAVNDGFLTLRLPKAMQEEIEAVAKEYGSTTSEVTRYYLSKGIISQPKPDANKERLLKRQYAELLYKEFVGRYSNVEISDAETRQAELDGIWMRMLELTGGDEAEATRLLIQLSRSRGSAADWMAETMKPEQTTRIEEA